MTESKIDVKHIAKLAKLEFSDNDLERMTRDLTTILDYMDKLNELDTQNVEPLFHVIELKNVFRDDTVNPSYPVEEILKNSPAKTEKFFRVPKVIGQ